MDLLKEITDIFGDVQNFTETKNYYFEKHNCEKTGEDKKILLDFTVGNETTDMSVLVTVQSVKLFFITKILFQRDYNYYEFLV